MKFKVIFVFLFFCFVFRASAQNDTLIITLFNGGEEKIPLSQIQKVTFEDITSINEQSKPPAVLDAKGNYPNPFSYKTVIEFEIASPGDVAIFIFNNIGKQVQTLRCGNCPAGRNNLEWNGLDKNGARVQSGVYYYEIRFGKETRQRNMIVVY